MPCRRGDGFLGFGIQSVTYAWLGENAFRPEGVALDLASQIAHGDMEKVECTIVIDSAPHLPGELPVRGNIALPPDKRSQERVFGATETHLFTIYLSSMPDRINRYAATFVLPAKARTRAAAKKGPYASQQFSSPKWFCNIVIGAAIQYGGFFRFLTTDRDDEDWTLA